MVRRKTGLQKVKLLPQQYFAIAKTGMNVNSVFLANTRVSDFPQFHKRIHTNMRATVILSLV